MDRPARDDTREALRRLGISPESPLTAQNLCDLLREIYGYDPEPIADVRLAARLIEAMELRDWANFDVPFETERLTRDFSEDELRNRETSPYRLLSTILAEFLADFVEQGPFQSHSFVAGAWVVENRLILHGVKGAALYTDFADGGVHKLVQASIQGDPEESLTAAVHAEIVGRLGNAIFGRIRLVVTDLPRIA